MSESELTLPNLPPPEYLGQKVHTISESDWNHYSSELGLRSHLKPITIEANSARRITDALSAKNKSPSVSDPPLARSDAWSNFDSAKPSEKLRSTKCKSNCQACIKSIKCRFTALGIFLGLLLSLAAIIPITVIWQTSNSANSISSVKTFMIFSDLIARSCLQFYVNKGADSSLNVSAAIITNNSYFVDEQVVFTTNTTSIALSLIVRVQRADNATYHATYNSYDTIINSTYTTTDTEIIYTFFIQDAQVLTPGNYSCNVQFQLPNVNHVTSSDTYSVQTTNICGVINTVSGNFPSV